MKNIHILPTDKPSRLCIDNSCNELNYSEIEGLNSKHITNQHIYITNSEEIKEGSIVKIPCGVGRVKELHWKYGNDFPSYIVEDIFVYKLRYGQKEGELQTNSFRYEDVKKIILTTDLDLQKDGVQAIPDEFLEWFVKNPSCEKVEVVKTFEDYTIVGGKSDEIYYKIIIPKEEPKQEIPQIGTKEFNDLASAYFGGKPIQETLEEAALKKYNYSLFINEEKRPAFIEGAKWQQTQDKNKYSEEDMHNLMDEYQNWLFNTNTVVLTFREWFEQFKKK